MLPDLRTIVLILVVTTFIAAIALFLFYRLIKEINGLQYAAIGGGCQALGSVFLLLRDSIDPMVSLSGLNVLSLFVWEKIVAILTSVAMVSLIS